MTFCLRNIIQKFAFFLLLALYYLSETEGKIRKKRLLHFPEKTNVVLTMSLLKLFPSDTILNTLTEYDVAFPVPLHPYKLPNKRVRRQIEHNIIHQKLETISNLIGFEGDCCSVKFICAVKKSFGTENDFEDDLLKDVMDILLNLKTSTDSCT